MKTIHKNIADDFRDNNRSRVELVCKRLHFLDETDKIMMKLYLEHNASIRLLSTLFKVSQQKINRRIKRLTRILTSRAFYSFRKNLNKLNPVQKMVARDFYFSELTLRQIAHKNGWSYYRARKTLSQVKKKLKKTVNSTR